MKTKTIKTYLLSISIIVSAILSSCGGSSKAVSKEDAEALDAYVEMNSNEATRKFVLQSGIFSDYSCNRDGYDMIVSFYFYSDTDLSSTPEDVFASSTSEVIESIANDYLNNKVAFDAIETMKNNCGDFIYEYYDANGVKREMKFPATAIIDFVSNMPDDKDLIDAYAKANATDEIRNSWLEDGSCVDYSCTRSGYDIVLKSYYADGYDLTLITEDELQNESTIDASSAFVKDYLSSDKVKKAIDAMNRHGGRIIYEFYDKAGVKRGYTIDPADIIAVAQQQD